MHLFMPATSNGSRTGFRKLRMAEEELPSGRTGVNPDGSTGPVYYQQQVLAGVPRSTIATGY
jgi:hypothetical protein